MPKKTTILIAVLLIFTVGLVYVAIKTEQQSPPDLNEEELTEEELTDIVPTINPQTQLSFSPATIDTGLNPQATYTVNVTANTNGQAISGIQLELAYDPAILTDVTIEPADNNLFGLNPTVLVSSVDPDLGRISFQIATPGLDDEEVTGNANIAEIKFSTIPNQVQTTQISVLPKTTARSIRSTNPLLQSALPLNIIFSTPAAQITTAPTLPPTDVLPQ